MLGVNVGARGHLPAAVESGARWVRLVLVPAASPEETTIPYRKDGLQVLAVLARESFPTDDFERQAEAYARLHGAAITAYQVGNEPDHASPSSWTMTQAAYADLVRRCSAGIKRVRPAATLIGAGGASGDPSYFDRRDILRHLDAVACHPYGQDADTCPAPSGNFGRAADLIGRYAALGRPVWATEFGADDTEAGNTEAEVGRYVGAMGAQLRDDPRVPVATHFCLTDAMVRGFGLTSARGDAKMAWHAFRAATAGMGGGGGVATTEERLAQLEKQQSLQSEAISQILANHYQDGPASAKGLLVQLDPNKYGNLAVVEKQDAG